MKTILIQTEYITLGQFLKFSSIISNGGEAKFFLENNIILVNNIEEKRRGKKLFNGDIVEINKKKYEIKKQYEIN